ncbi:MAG: hypothetical protein PHX83_07625 [Acidobacteriia bacterium]|nr:hypothetical protein [Terriglobia bacterium]
MKIVLEAGMLRFLEHPGCAIECTVVILQPALADERKRSMGSWLFLVQPTRA